MPHSCVFQLLSKAFQQPGIASEGSNNFATGIAANGNAYCQQPASTNLSDHSTLVLNNQANAFSGGEQTLAPSAAGYASLNLPNTGAAPSNPLMGDLWLTTADAHPKFRDKTNTTQSLAFLSDVTSSSLLTNNNTFTGNNIFTGNNNFTGTTTFAGTINAGTINGSDQRGQCTDRGHGNDRNERGLRNDRG